MLPINFHEANQNILLSITNYDGKKTTEIQLKKLHRLQGLLKTSLFDTNQELFDKLLNFLTNIDLNHAELPFFIDKYISDCFFNKCEEFLRVKLYCKKNKLSICKDISYVGKFLNSYIFQDFYNYLGNPIKTKVYTRFLNEKTRRDTRASKKKQIIYKKNATNLASLEMLGIESFFHGSLSICKFLEQMVDKKIAISTMECSFLKEQIDCTISRISDIINLQKLGFHRVPISKMVHEFSKIFGFDKCQIMPIFDKNQIEDGLAQEIFDKCENFNFEDKTSCIFDHYSEIKWEESKTSVLIGEIDTKSYFICFINRN